MIINGQKYVVIDDMEITCMTACRAPFTGGYERILPIGEEFIITNDPPADATAV